jgi:A/G-specific adenine glycosylase
MHADETANNNFNNLDQSTTVQVKHLRENLVEWHKKHARKYPWRQSHDPYEILIAEIMLRRTRADQVVPVYINFLNHYPTIESLFKANEKQISKLTQPLGLYWRNRNLVRLAKHIVYEHDGKIPENRRELVLIPGVGEYVAGAFLSFFLNRKEWIVDTNIIRVFSRFFGIEIHGDGRRNKEIVKLAKAYVDCNYPREANLAIIDFAALICKKFKPLHQKCLVNDECHHYGGLHTDK